MGRMAKYKDRIKATYTEWKDDDAQTWAASVAYYAVFSLAPLMILALAIAGFVAGKEAARGELTQQMSGMVGAQGAPVIQSAIANAGTSGGGVLATIFSSVILIIGATKVFSELQTALNRIWDVRVDPDAGWKGVARKRITGFIMVFAVGILLLAAVGLSTFLTGIQQYLGNVFAGAWFWELINAFGSFAIIWLVFALMFKYVPDVEIEWSDVWFGAFITAVLFVIGKFLMGLYLSQGSFGSAYGAASSLLAVLAWVYYSSQIFFFGAEYTQVHARREGSGIQPDEHAVREADTLQVSGGAQPSAG